MLMNKIFLLLLISTISISQSHLEIYNSFEVPIYVSIVKNNNKPLNFQEIKPGTFVTKNVTYKPVLTIAITEQIPTSKTKLAAFNITSDQDQVICLKTYTTRENKIFLIPQKPAPGVKPLSFGEFSLERNIAHTQILKTSIDFEPRQTPPEYLQKNEEISSSPAKFESTNNILENPQNQQESPEEPSQASETTSFQVPIQPSTLQSEQGGFKPVS